MSKEISPIEIDVDQNTIPSKSEVRPEMHLHVGHSGRMIFGLAALSIVTAAGYQIWPADQTADVAHNRVAQPENPEPSNYPTFVEILNKLDLSLDRQLSTRPGKTLTKSPVKGKTVLTFDVCASYRGHELTDALKSLELISQKGEFPAMIFISGAALKKPELKEAVTKLAALPHISIQPHGLEHRPCTSEHTEPIYGQKPTGSLEASYREIVGGAEIIEALTGKRPRYFRSPSLYSDSLVEQMVRALGMQMVSRSAYADDSGGLRGEWNHKRDGVIYLGHVTNTAGVDNIYKYLEKSGARTVVLP